MLDQLGRYALFDGLSGDDLQLAAPLFSSLDVPADTTLFEQNRAAELFYLVVSGRIILRYKPFDGPEMRLTSVAAGGAVGWSAVTGNPIYTATAITSLPCELLAVRGDDLRHLLQEHPQTGQRLLKRLAMAVSPRWEGAYQQVVNLISQSFESQVHQ
jgi:CRP/FNR family transcriptional regulator, cyclic AMP receptor protein